MKRPPLILLTSLTALALSCGDDAARAVNNGTNNQYNNNNVQDMSLPPQDMSLPPQDMATTGRTYSPDIIDPPLPSSCNTPLVTQPGALRARVFTTSLRVDLRDLTDHLAWRTRINAMLWRHVLPCRAQDAPNLVVFPEAISLPMTLIGDKAAPSRARTDSASALALMANGLATPLAYYQSLYPEAPLPRQLLLASTDTLARATLDTFAQLADHHDLYIAVPINTAPWERVEDPALVATLGDSDYDGLSEAWRANSDRVKPVTLIFGPDGQLVHRAERLHLSEQEIRVLSLVPGDFTRLSAAPLPWGRTAVASTLDARMPNVQDRLDDLGAQLYLEPEAAAASWTRQGRAPSEPGLPPSWEPDLFMMSGWNLLQRAPRGVALVVSRLTGNLFELGFDGQLQLVEKASTRADQFVGQRAPLAGNALISPWVTPDPALQDPTLSLAQRRDVLELVGESLQPASSAPASGLQIEGVWAMDLTQPEQGRVETHPAVARSAQRELLALSEGVPGRRKIMVRQLDGARAQRAIAELSHPDYDLVHPQIVAASDGTIHLVTEAIGKRLMGANEGAQDNRLLYARLREGEAYFEDVALLQMAGSWAYHPSLAITANTLHLAWTQHTQGAQRAFYAQSVVGKSDGTQPFERAVAIALDPRPAAAEQWDVRVAASGQRVAAAWLDYQDRRWSVLVSTSIDAGLSWSTPTPLDQSPADVISLHASPTITALSGGGFLVAWTHLVESGLSTAIALRRISSDQRGNLKLGALHMLGSLGDADRWERTPALSSPDPVGMNQIVWVEQQQATTTLRVATYNPELDALLPTQRAIAAPRGAYLPQLLLSSDGQDTTLVYEASDAKDEIIAQQLGQQP